MDEEYITVPITNLNNSEDLKAVIGQLKIKREVAELIAHVCFELKQNFELIPTIMHKDGKKELLHVKIGHLPGKDEI